jgi:hypothetical protein
VDLDLWKAPAGALYYPFSVRRRFQPVAVAAR